MKQIDCETAGGNLMEAARRRGFMDADVQAHLDGCPACADLWQGQQSLTANLRLLRIQSSGQRSSPAARAAIMQDFAAQSRAPRGHRWVWAVAVAAVFLLGAFLVRDLTNPRQGGEAGVSELASGAEPEARDEGFIDIPYAPPLAQGEMVRVVHTALQPAELASLGVNVDPSWATELPADLLVGQDGFPRAVRLSNEASEVSEQSGS
jgi:hypothetical protein